MAACEERKSGSYFDEPIIKQENNAYFPFREVDKVFSGAEVKGQELAEMVEKNQKDSD